MIYFLTFFLSIVFCAIGEYYLKLRRPTVYRIAFAASVLILAILAGVRDYNIGTDVITYGNYMYYAARNQNKLGLYLASYPQIEVLYSIFVFIIAKFTNSAHWLYFFTGIIIYGFTLSGLLKYKKNISVSIGWLCFVFIFYGDTLNAMRQSIAMSIVFWGFHFAMKKQFAKYFMTVFIAVLFHNTAIIAFGIYMLYWLLRRKNNVVVRVSIIAGVYIALMFSGLILQKLIDIGILHERLSRYAEAGIGVDLNPILLRLPFLLMIWLYYGRFCSYNDRDSEERLFDRCEGTFLVLMLIIEILVSQTRKVIPAVYRISFYFGYYRSVAYSRLLKINRGNNKLIIGLLLLVYLIVMWVYQNIYQGNNEIYPFTSEILGIY